MKEEGGGIPSTDRPTRWRGRWRTGEREKKKEIEEMRREIDG